MRENTVCPCGSSLTYTNCCQPFHNNSMIANTAEQLMRSRYTAYVLQNVDYIIATTVPAQQVFLDKKAIGDLAKTTDWAELEIINHNPRVDKIHASVEFKAVFNVLENRETKARQIKQKFHHELSYFVKIKQQNQEKWYFLDPTLYLTISQKQPCMRGSGEKFKRCCGKFI